MFPRPEEHGEAELRVGLSAQFERDVSEGDIVAFAQCSGDFNPLHVDPAYAAKTSYGTRIAHGAFQVGLASAIVGMHLPGRNALLTLFDARFPAPLRFPTRVLVRGEIMAWNPAANSGRLRVTVTEIPGNLLTAEVGVGFSLHHGGEKREKESLPPAKAWKGRDRPLVLVTGAAGGIGSEILRGLSVSYSVLALYHRSPLPKDLGKADHVKGVQANLSEPGWAETLAGSIEDGSLYGIVHCAWPGMPKGGLVSLPRGVVETQLSFGTLHLIELARLLSRKAPPEGGRLVALGSAAGSFRPSLNLAAYSLAKGAMEQTVRLLAAELAIRKITVNAVSPSFVPTGINQQVDERRQKLESARVPMGRLCSVEDVHAAVDFLLSPGASFVSGQVIGLAGAQL